MACAATAFSGSLGTRIQGNHSCPGCSRGFSFLGEDSFTTPLTRQYKCDTRVSVNRKTYTTREAAKAAGITRITLQRWITAGKIRAPQTQLVDGVGKRLWSNEDISRLRKAKEEIYRKGRGRKPKAKR